MISKLIAKELKVAEGQILATIQLLDEGATVPFIARYRKEKTGGLDDVQLRLLEERLHYLRELEERRAKVLASIEEQGQLTPALEAAILAADTKTRLEDLYLPYKVKRRTRAAIARERGLEPLARALLEDPTLVPEVKALEFVDAAKEVADADAALEGARHILIERFATDAELIQEVRRLVLADSRLSSRVVAGKEAEGARFSDYFDHLEPLSRVPSHRALAMLRARKEGIVRLDLLLDEQDENLGTDTSGMGMAKLCRRFGIQDQGRPADRWLLDGARLAWRARLSTHIESESLSRLREQAETEAIAVFARNLKALLLAAPAGPKCILGLDPGLRTGVKVAVVDGTGKVLATDTIYPTPPRNDWERSLESLAKLVETHDVQLVSTGNGTGSRETVRLVDDLLKRMGPRRFQQVVVNEAGASVYSASELASRELPDLDVTLRGAASIARRLQDPLAELVKIEPKAIGVGQYQHDVNQGQLGRGLDAVIEDCVNAVGVDVNTASPALLNRVAGLSRTMADNLVAYRNANGAFKNRQAILKVPRLGKKAFEQCAGFLRVMDGDNPLDRSAVHPEAYSVVERISKDSGRPVASILGDSAFLRQVDARRFTDEEFGLPTVTDILQELQKPGRDPRPEFETANFKEGVEELEDLRPDMVLEGVVSNVTNFGAFVDVGVHQDGLVHISQISHDYVKDPSELLRAGQVVKVKVMSIDLERKRVALSMRLDDESTEFAPGGQARVARGARGQKPGAQRGQRSPRRPEPKSPVIDAAPPKNNPFARAFEDLEKKKEP